MDTLDLDQIIDAVGREPYRLACDKAWKAAQYTGQWNPPEYFSSDIPQDIIDLIWESSLQDGEKVKLMFQVYGEMPCYGLFFGLKVFHWRELPAEARKLFWREARSLLSQDDEALTQPLAYSLWCDFFEDREDVAEAWDELVVSRFSGDGIDALPTDTTSGAMHEGLIDNGTANLLRQVFDVSGPVPFELKEELYTRLIADSSFHQNIFYSLLYSCFNVYGQIDKQKAQEWLQRLDLPADTEYLEKLRDCLA